MEDKKNIRRIAQSIVDNGNGYGVPCSELLKLDEHTRKDVWEEIVKMGQEEDNICPYCGNNY